MNIVLEECPVKFTEGAIKEIKYLLSDNEIPDNYGLRIGVEGGGCSGLSYILGFDEAKEIDDTFEVDGVKILMNKAHGMYLIGMEIDFLSGLENRGFLFNNPNAKDTCGCGTSFATD